ncbi:MAG TPA: DUF1320 domain-containing protein [Nitrospirae bacterium]|nr:DUF1320 domain-containing protein [Nitrospirota bacterium]HDK41677.1 DUF1320 domain-containing protein [Nitrospirota bacterium]HDK81005.1 DUF1320 domain-containing protein [Nitrospirota bacterium]
MAYCTLTEIKDRIPEENLIQLTDDDNRGIVDQGKVDAAILDADEVIDGYLRGRYTLPLSPVPALLNKISIDIAVFNLYSRKLEFEMAEVIKDRHKNALKLLTQIQSGTVTLGTASGETPEPGQYKTNKTSDDKTFDKDTLDKY